MNRRSTTLDSQTTTRDVRLPSRLRDYKLLALLVVLGVLLIGLGAFTNVLGTVVRIARLAAAGPQPPVLLVEGHSKRGLRLSMVNPPTADVILITGVTSVPYPFTGFFRHGMGDAKCDLDLQVDDAISHGPNLSSRTIRIAPGDAASFNVRALPSSDRLSEIWFYIVVNYVTAEGKEGSLESAQAFRYAGGALDEFLPRAMLLAEQLAELEARHQRNTELLGTLTNTDQASRYQAEVIREVLRATDAAIRELRRWR